MIRRRRFQAKPIMSSQTKKTAEEISLESTELSENNLSSCLEINSIFLSSSKESNSPKKLPSILKPEINFSTLESPQKNLESLQNCLKSPQNCLKSPQNCLESPQNCLESPQNCLESPQNCLESPQNCLESPQNCLESPQNCLENPQNCLENPQEETQNCLENPQEETQNCLENPQEETQNCLENLQNSVEDIIVDYEIEVDIDKIEKEPDINENDYDEKKLLKRRRKSVLRNEDLDTKKFTLADLIDWRPKTENTLRKKWDEKRQKMLENMSNSSTSSTNEKNEDTVPKTTETKSTGPRVKINEKGEMVLDEDSLIVTNVIDVDLWETVDDDLMPKKLNSMSFRRRIYKRSVNWSVFETDLFYVLSATGIDFGLMHEFISSRTRYEIKKKFQREEKLNALRIKETLTNPTILDETLYTRIERLKNKIKQELEEKLLAKQNTVKAPRGRPRKICPVTHEVE